MQTVIDKVELIDNVMTYTEFAQTNDQSLIEEINLNYDSTLGAWIETNIVGLEAETTLPKEFFDVTPLVYTATTTLTQGNDLPVVNSMGEL